MIYDSAPSSSSPKGRLGKVKNPPLERRCAPLSSPEPLRAGGFGLLADVTDVRFRGGLVLDPLRDCLLAVVFPSSLAEKELARGGGTIIGLNPASPEEPRLGGLLMGLVTNAPVDPRRGRGETEVRVSLCLRFGCLGGFGTEWIFPTSPC